jgi:Uma2 family endonuclease
MTIAPPPPPIKTIHGLLDRLGGVPASRVRFHPVPGTATEQDVISVNAHEDRLCELVDGVLVEKPIGYRESIIAGAILAALRAFVVPRKLGVITGESGMMKWFPGAVRIPDVTYVSRERLPGGRVPTEPVPLLSPDLTVEVLSESNTAAEMARKRQEYFASGGRLDWEVDPDARTVTVYTSPIEWVVLTADQSLDGGSVLPGFTLPIQSIFAELDAAM